MKNVSFENCFETLANSTRMKIIRALAKEPLSVRGLSKKLKAEQSRVSHSLKDLKACGYVEARAKGKEKIYSLKKEFGKAVKGAKSDKALLEAIFGHIEDCCVCCK